MNIKHTYLRLNYKTLYIFVLFFFFSFLLCSKKNNEDIAQDLYLKGKEAYQKQNMESAEKFFHEASNKNKKLLNAKLMLAKINYYKKNFNNALIILDKILKSDSNHVNSLYLKAKISVLNSGSNPENIKETDSEAVKSLNRILEIDSYHIPARLLLALLYEKNKAYKEAIYEYKAALESQEVLINARANLGILYKRMGLDDKSREEMRTAIKIADSLKIKSNNLLLLLEEIEK